MRVRKALGVRFASPPLGGCRTGVQSGPENHGRHRDLGARHLHPPRPALPPCFMFLVTRFRRICKAVVAQSAGGAALRMLTVWVRIPPAVRSRSPRAEATV